MKLFGTASIYFGANIINAAIPFLLLPILTRILTPAEYGSVAMFLVMVSIFSSFTGLSVHGAVGVRYFQLSKDEFSGYVTSCIGVLIASTISVLLLLILLHKWAVNFSGLNLEWLMVAVLVSSSQFLINIRLSILQVSGFVWNYSGLQISRSFLDAALTLVFLFGLGMAWKGRLLGYSMSAGLVALVGAVWLYKDGYIKKSLLWRVHVKDALKFGLPLIPHSIGGMLMVLVDRLLINRYLGSEAVGIYMVALQFGMAIALITESFNKAYAPWLFKSLEKNSHTLRVNIVRGTYLYFGLIIITGVLYGMLLPVLLPFIVGENFVRAGELVIFIALGYSIHGCYYMVTNYIFYANKNSSLALITLSSGILNIPVTYILIQDVGLLGASLAFLIINVIVFVGTWVAASRAHSMPWIFAKGRLQ